MRVFLVCTEGCLQSEVSVLRCLSVAVEREDLFPQELYHELSYMKEAFVCERKYSFETKLNTWTDINPKNISVHVYWWFCFVCRE